MLREDPDCKKAKEDRIGIFVMINDLDRSSSVINLIISLANEGYIVDIFSPNAIESICRKYRNVNFFTADFNIRKTLNLNLIKKIYSKSCESKKRYGLTACFAYYIFFGRYIYLIWYLNWITDIIKDKNYKCYIGIEKIGLIMSLLLNYGTPIIYYSLELYYSSSMLQRVTFYAIRKLEIVAHNNSTATIIQDEERKKILYEYNEICDDNIKTLFLPVSMIGDSVIDKNDYLFEKCGIPRDKKILLQLGMIGQARMSEEIAKSALKWPNDWVLVMHGSGNDAIKNKIRKINNKNLYISDETLPFDGIPQVVASADIGLVFYKSNSDFNFYNNFYIGASSGQLAHHLQCGLPIISIDIPSLKDVIDEFSCGLVVDNADSIESAAKSILANYSIYRRNAFDCFNEMYRYERYFKEISRFISKKI
jgi:glycosyltransferase involved in cell wall biosynthesis